MYELQILILQHLREKNRRSYISWCGKWLVFFRGFNLSCFKDCKLACKERERVKTTKISSSHHLFLFDAAPKEIYDPSNQKSPKVEIRLLGLKGHAVLPSAWTPEGKFEDFPPYLRKRFKRYSSFKQKAVWEPWEKEVKQFLLFRCMCGPVKKRARG